MTKKTVWLPYDFDTAIGINNEGALVFSYDLKDIDHTSGGADVYNGQDSVLWQNVRAAYADEIKAMYKQLRSSGALSYEKVEQMFENHQNKWSEAILNEDAQFKYLDPLINDNDAAYISMLQGSKAEQRKWWLWNRFRYLDSKYNAGDALTQVITVRGYAKDNITVTPYASIYATIKYGSYLVQQRAARNVPVTLINPLDNVNDTEIYIYSADQIADIGDLSGLKIGYGNFSYATKLVNLKIGDSSENYSNGNLTELYLGNNTLLQTLDVRNCPNLTQAVDISGCTNIEEVYFDGTSITGVTLPDGGVLNTLHLPDSVTSLIIRNQPKLMDFVLNDSRNVSTLVLENAGNIDSYTLLQSMSDGSRARIIGFEWNITGDEISKLTEKLIRFRGLDAEGNTVPLPQLSGSLSVDGSITNAELEIFENTFPDVTLTYTSIRASRFGKYVRNQAISGNDGIMPHVTQITVSEAFRNNSVLWFPNIREISSHILGYTNATATGVIGIGKQSDTQIANLTLADAFPDTRVISIYVPDSLLNDYKEATNWSEYSSKILPLSDAPYSEWNGGIYP